ncbi:uncharacterized protein LOC130052444 [Ostrea edulis]|uniref:uncharacterized protein LOC130052444 n=1 Tax=Ostrea edulis TaxID=37623 RepID=UPI0024AF7EA1|nr:uncharacterized protein LOC130052444 [Ostrea edulis]
MDIPVFIHTEDKSTSCNIEIELPNHCSACVLRNDPTISISDHAYFKTPTEPDSPLTSTPMKKPVTDSFHDSLETVSPVHKADDSFQFSEISFESPVSSPSASCSISQNTDKIVPKEAVNESKFTVFSSCLDILFKMIICQICHSPFDFDDVRKHNDGSALKVSFTCLNNHSYSWKSQPFIGKQPVGNILLTAATYASGNTFSSISSFASALGLNFMSKSIFYDIGNKFVLPAIDTFYNEQKDVLHARLKNKQLTVIGDGRCDSPGFCAKYCTYTIMEAVSSAILDFKVIQVTETGSSSRMELEGFKRSFTSLTDNYIKINTFCSDRHVQIRKYLKDHLPHISHQFDVWHLANSIRKKLVAVAKKRENEELIPWVRSIINHVWYCAAECRGDPELLIEMWTSILHHIQNVHSFHGDRYFECGHPQLSSEQSRKKKWLQKKSKAYKALEKIIMDKRIQKDIRQLNNFCHTGEIEVYHSMMLKYVPKRQEFQYPQMVARTQLAALDHNFNLNRDIKNDKHGQEVFAPQCSKATGRWSVKNRYEEKNYSFRKELLEITLENKMLVRRKRGECKY